MKFGARTWGKQDVRSGRERGLRRGLRGLNHDRKRSRSEALPLNIGQILKSKSRGVSTARSDDTIEAIAAQLSQRKIGAIVVVGDGGRVIGIISERDIIRMIAEHGSRALTMPASAGMTHDVKTCTRDCTVDQIMEAMTNGRFRHLPVVENGALIGIISIGDVVKYHTAEVELEVSAMRGYLATG
jgi:CBS domain-containing protein